MKTSIWIPGDQLLQSHPAIEMARGDDLCVLLVWTKRRVRRLPYQQKKLVLLLSAMRHYAERLQKQGIKVDFVTGVSLKAALKVYTEREQPDRVLTMAASEYVGRKFQTEKLAEIVGVPVEVLPNTQFLVGQYNPFPTPEPNQKIIMEFFYREMRRHFNVLIDSKKRPVGGDWNYDKLNRQPLPKRGIEAPAPIRFEPDEITQWAMDEIRREGHGVGSVDGFDYAVTHEQAQQALDDFIDYRLVDFGTYEDAMSSHHHALFHSMLSPYINIGLLQPMQMIRAAEKAYHGGRAPLNSVEGFIRQIIGWREFMYWQYWRQMPDLVYNNGWGAQRPMPQMFWDGETKMNCIHHVVQRARDTGWTHHIERLMIISNFCLMAGIYPQAVVEWFTSFYIDAYDWVMQSNVVGMGLNADEGQTATKPYVSSANYINKMSDYCKGCYFHYNRRTGERACPYNYLYWNFLIEHEEVLRSNPRFGPAVLGLRHLDEDERKEVQAEAQAFLEALAYYGRRHDTRSTSFN